MYWIRVRLFVKKEIIFMISTIILAHIDKHLPIWDLYGSAVFLYAEYATRASI